MASDQQQGIMLIPDISGFTEFVSEVEISHSEHIITELLGLLINANSLNLHLCEIEGDALFFYRGGRLPTLDQVIEQVQDWFLKFHEHLNLLKRDSTLGTLRVREQISVTSKPAATSSGRTVHM